MQARKVLAWLAATACAALIGYLSLLGLLSVTDGLWRPLPDQYLLDAYDPIKRLVQSLRVYHHDYGRFPKDLDSLATSFAESFVPTEGIAYRRRDANGVAFPIVTARIVYQQLPVVPGPPPRLWYVEYQSDENGVVVGKWMPK
jgi:hypothetical protein